MSRKTVEAGDFVIVRDDKDVVKQLQEDHGGWVDTMVAVSTVLFHMMTTGSHVQIPHFLVHYFTF